MLFTFPSRYLFTIGYRVVFSLGRWSSQLPTGFHVPRGTRETVPGRHIYAGYRAITVYGRTFQIVLLYICLVTSRAVRNPLRTAPTTPIMQRLRAYTQSVWALPISLAATLRISVDFCSCRYLDVSVPCVRLVALWIQTTISRHDSGWVPPFGIPRIKACLAAPHGLSQLTTSFIASRYQGIHRMPLVA